MSQRIVITGASSGIGAALAWEYAGRGYDIGLCARRAENMEVLCTELHARYPSQQFIYETLDVNNLESVAPVLKTLAARLGRIDVLIANAGVTGVRRTGNGKLDIDVGIIQTNLLGAIATIDAAVAIFREQDRGHLVGISSFSAFRGIPGSAAYSASKAALSNYLEAVRTELHKKNIQVTTIHPGFIKTDLADNMERFPFVIEAPKAARLMAEAIRKRKKEATVPAWPWNFLRILMKKMPDSVVAKMF